MAKGIPYGRRLLPQLVDQIAEASPEKAFAEVARVDWRRDGWGKVTYGQVARAVDALSWWLDETFEQKVPFETFVYAGPSDLRYALIPLAAMKTRRTVLLLDPVMSMQSRLKLVDDNRCKILLLTEAGGAAIEETGQHRPQCRIVRIPSLESLIDTTDVAPYPFSETFDEVKDDPVFISHSSGTTGNPKSISYTHAAIGCMDLAGDSSRTPPHLISRYDILTGPRVLISMPHYWVGGLYGILFTNIFHGSLPILLPRDSPKPLNAEYVDEVIQRTSPDYGGFPPSILKELCKHENMLNRLSKFQAVGYAGAPLEKWVGDLLIERGVQILVGIGSVETSSLPVYLPRDCEDWSYYRFSEATGIFMEPFSDDLHELVIRKTPESEDFQAVFKIYPQLNEWRTKDLYRRHPDPAKSDYWLYVGRGDDFVKLSWLAKFHASEVESAIGKHPLVEIVFMAGDGRDSPCLLVDLVEGEKSRSKEELMDEIWSAVEEVNKANAEPVRIKKELILLADPLRSFKRLGKGTLDRRGTLEAYRADIDRLYGGLGKQS